MISYLNDFVRDTAKTVRVLVFGDAMLDKYYYGEVTRISPEAPVPVTRVLSSKETLGGAANVAHNLALLGCHVELFASVGDDFHARSLISLLTSRGIGYGGLISVPAPTTTKLRIIGGHQQMMRLDFEETGPLLKNDADELIRRLTVAMDEGAGALIISDYGKGTVTPDTSRRVIALARERHIPVVADPKGADWEKYRGADYITPNLAELNEVLTKKTANEDASVEAGAREILGRFGIGAMVATRSEKGLSLVTSDGAKHIAARAREVFDVSGAGDTVIAVFAMALAGGLPPETAAYLSNLAAGIVVGKLGTYAVSSTELLAAMEQEDAS